MSRPEHGDPVGFLARWSRRKREADTPRDPEALDAAELARGADGSKPGSAQESDRESGPAATQAATARSEGATPDGEGADEPAFDPATLPALDEITAESDIRAFLRKGVPEALKNAALQRMWRADPAIRDYIGPVDYGWDFNNPESIPGFGALPADFDAERVIRQLTGVDETATETPSGAVRPDPDSPQVPSLESPSGIRQAEAAPIEAGASATPAIAEASPADDVPAEDEPVDDRPLFRRRHGSALPRL